MIDPVNVSLVVQKIIKEKLATYHDLSTIYSLEDSLNILEVYEVGLYNDQKIEEVRNYLRGK